MAEVKNSFLSSKMNKDLDDRLVPNNEYRDASNVLIGKSLGSDTGVLQSIAGNQLVADLVPSDSVCIGAISDHVNDRVIAFLTNYEDPSPANITPVPPAYVVKPTSTVLTGALSINLVSVNSMVKPGMTVTVRPYNIYADITAIYTIKTVTGNTITLNKPVVSTIATSDNISISYTMQIAMYSVTNPPTVNVLVQGDFLNFANNNVFNITGVNILEDLLFWTDNRNQPRKINIDKALSSSTYYNREDLISVAKYNPVNPITLFKKINVTTTSSSTSASGYTSFTVSLADGALLRIGDQLITNTLSVSSYVIVYNIVNNVSSSTITLTTQNTITNGSILTFYRGAMMDESKNPNWKGDTSFLKDKYIRFSYRYKFNDGEYSLIAPFSQIIYIPSQKGYFFGGDETKAYTSTVLSWMENMVNSVIFTIELPQALQFLQSDYGIEKIEILYKESDSLKLSVLETIDLTNSGNAIDNLVTNNILTFQYNSQKPYKTLPTDQITRVYDKIPIRAKAQEISGNRVIYGNFIATNTSPSKIDYLVSVNNKSKDFDSWIEYPNHTLKQNRTYQVGIVLSDKSGRQSPVILSSSTQGSTLYAPFSTNTVTPKDWYGDALNVTFNSVIQSNKSESSGEPGLYATISGSIPNSTDGFQVQFNNNTYIYSAPGYGRGSYNNALVIYLTTPSTDQKNLPVLGGYLKGEYTDYVKIVYMPTSTICIADGTISSEYLPKQVTKDVKYAYSINPMGWYSYKVVVKQQQQEYYNVYLPGMLNGYPSLQTATSFPTNEINRIAHTVLINDNINKVPRDLTEVGPDQKQYRSSVNLFCRVNNIGLGTVYNSYNTQYFPSTIPDVVSTIATSTELNFETTTGTASDNFYQLDTKPSIARITTVKEVGTVAVPPQGGTNLMIPTLSVYETAPDISLLDIYWESTTSGLISDLNEKILLGEDAVVNLTPLGFNFFENQNPSGEGTNTGAQDSPFITNSFWPTSNGAKMTDSNITLTVVNNNNLGISVFQIVKTIVAGGPTYRVKITSSVQFLSSYNQTGVYTFTFNITDNTTGLSYTKIINGLQLQNNSPIITAPANGFTVEVPTNSPGGNVQLFTGNNGSSLISSTDCNWSISSVSPANIPNVLFGMSNFPNSFGYLTARIGEPDTYSIIVKLEDAYSNGTTAQTLQDTSQVIVSARNFVIATTDGYCTAVNTGATSATFTVTGKIDVWRSLVPGEYVTGFNNLSLKYTIDNNPNPSTFAFPQSSSFTTNSRLYINYSFTYNVTTGGTNSSNYLKWINFYGYFTTNLGRNIMMNQLDTYSQTTPIGYYQVGSFIYNGSISPGTASLSPATYYRPNLALSAWTATNNGFSNSWFQGLYDSAGSASVIGNNIEPSQIITSTNSSTVINTTMYTEPGSNINITYP